MVLALHMRLLIGKAAVNIIVRSRALLCFSSDRKCKGGGYSCLRCLDLHYLCILH